MQIIQDAHAVGVEKLDSKSYGSSQNDQSSTLSSGILSIFFLTL